MGDNCRHHLQRLFIVVTDKCNARCKLCNYWETTPGGENFLSLSFIQDKIVPLIRERGVEAVCITGGEPALHPHLPEIIKEINGTGVTITVVTNGTGLPALFERVKYDVHAWFFSLDASNRSLHAEIRGLDNFDELMAWLERLKSTYPGVQIAFNCLLQKKNVRDIVNIYELICSLPCEGIFFNVPELKTHCFRGINKSFWRSRNLFSTSMLLDPIARPGIFPTQRIASQALIGSPSMGPAGGMQALLDDEKMEILKGNLAKIRKMDVEGYRYKLMQGDGFFNRCAEYFDYLRGRGEGVDFGNAHCAVPFTSMVVDETGGMRPCFYLPPVSVEEAGGAEIREKYCRYCFQFKG
ncbi:MAG: radical SAM protein [bacterium]|nr:radical SAM protein [bacterium]